MDLKYEDSDFWRLYFECPSLSDCERWKLPFYQLEKQSERAIYELHMYCSISPRIYL